MSLNETVAQAINATNSSAVVNSTLSKVGDATIAAQSFIPLVFIRLWDLMAAPFIHQEMLWIIFPLFFTLIVMEFYYDRHDDEELGWGAALANSLILIIVSIDLIRHSFHNETPWQVLKEIMLAIFADGVLPIAPQVLILIIFLAGLGFAITLINYFHLLPRKMAFVVSGHPPVNFLAYFAIAIVYSTGTTHEIAFDIPTLIAAGLLFIIILLVVFGIKRLVRKLTGDDSYYDRDRRW